MTTIKEPFDLRALLATMKSAKEKGVHMAIWDRDIQAVEDAIGVIQAVRSHGHDQNKDAPMRFADRHRGFCPSPSQKGERQL